MRTIALLLLAALFPACVAQPMYSAEWQTAKYEAMNARLAELNAKITKLTADYIDSQESTETIATAIVSECRRELLAWDNAAKDHAASKTYNERQERLFRAGVADSMRDREREMHASVVAYVLKLRRERSVQHGPPQPDGDDIDPFVTDNPLLRR